MGRNSPITATLIVVLLALPSSVKADEDEAFRLAENTFQYQDYEKAVELLTALFEPVMQLKDKTKIRTAYEYLGAAHWFQGNKEAAEEAFTRLLLLSAEQRLDPLFYPPTLVQFYDEVVEKLQRLELIAGKEKNEETKPPEDKPEKQEIVRVRRETIEYHPYVTAFVPFGVGQFYNGDNIGGSIFLVSEVLALGTAITSYYMILDTAKVDKDLAEKWETAFWVSQATFLGLAITGIIEAALRYDGDRRSVEEFDEAPSSEGDKIPTGESKSRSFIPQLGILPSGGIMIGVGQRF